MKKIFATFALALMTASSFAQGGKLEPEYIGQVVVVNADSTSTLLRKEKVDVKASSSKFGMIPIPGSTFLDKVKSYLEVKGKKSPSTLRGGKLTFIVRVKDNDVEPKSAFALFGFDTSKKNRRFQLSEVGFGGAKATQNLNTVESKVRKYGESSYLVEVENVSPGQYAFIVGDDNQCSTFGVD